MQPANAGRTYPLQMPLRPALRGNECTDTLPDHHIEKIRSTPVVERHVDRKRRIGASAHGTNGSTQVIG